MRSPTASNRVLLVCKAFPPTTGGVETFSEQLARAYSKRGLQVTVVTQTSSAAGWGLRTYPEGEVAVYNTGAGNQLFTGMRMARVVRRLTTDYHFHFLHSTTWRPALAARFARGEQRFVISVHGREVFSVGHHLRAVMRWVIRSSSLVVCVSHATRNRALALLPPSIDANRWVVAGNGLTFPRQASASELPVRRESARVTVLTLARLVERKNIAGCLRALASIANDRRCDFEYVVAGTGPLRGELQNLAEELGISDRVRFRGFVAENEVPLLYEQADIFLHPQIDLEGGSDFEGFGISIADAMSFGCAAVAGKGSGPSDFIEDGVTGVLVDGTDHQALTRSIHRLILDSEIRNELGSAGRAYVREHLSWDRHVATVLNAIEAAPPKSIVRRDEQRTSTC